MRFADSIGHRLPDRRITDNGLPSTTDNGAFDGHRSRWEAYGLGSLQARDWVNKGAIGSGVGVRWQFAD